MAWQVEPTWEGWPEARLVENRRRKSPLGR